jgi:hypothetical protein
MAYYYTNMIIYRALVYDIHVMDASWLQMAISRWIYRSFSIDGDDTQKTW